MKYVFDKNGIIDSENTERLVQYSVNANELQVAFTDLNIKEYVPYVAFERADGKVSPLIGMAFDRLNIGEEVYDCATYKFSDSWVTAVSGVLKVAIILKKNNVNARTSTFNLNVAESVSEDKVNYIDDVAYNELVGRVYQLEQKQQDIINGDLSVGVADKAHSDYFGHEFTEHYETKIGANEKVDALKQKIENGEVVGYAAHRDGRGNIILYTYETKKNAINNKTELNQKIIDLNDDLTDGTIIVKKAYNDSANNNIAQTYETKLDADEKLSAANAHTDNKIDELKRTLLGDNYNELYDTFKEISDYIASDETFAQEILTKIETNQRNISTNTSNIGTHNIRLNNLDSAVLLKANSSEVYKKTETYSQQEIDKLFEDNNNIQFVSDDFATIHESITPLDNSTLIGNWIFINEDFVEREMYSSNVNIAFKDSLGNEYKRIYFEPHSLKTENDKEYCKISVKGALEDDTYILIFNPVSKTGLAYNEQGILKNSYHLIFEKSGVTSSAVLQELILIANKVKFSTNVISDEFKYNNENIATIKDLDKTIGDINSILDTLNGEVV